MTGALDDFDALGDEIRLARAKHERQRDQVICADQNARIAEWLVRTAEGYRKVGERLGGLTGDGQRASAGVVEYLAARIRKGEIDG